MVREQHSDSKLNQELGAFSFHCTPHGHAGMFGANGKDNAAVSESFSINKVVDTTKGEILGLKANQVYRRVPCSEHQALCALPP